jgi:DNA mismatch repair protein MutL
MGARGELRQLAINILTPEVSALIAAGEVVERPASVVKELIENSLDAGASQISIEVRRGGLDSIRVTDDGEGMPESDLAVALQRYATSKLRKAEDLAQIHTLGFRGEALPSIAAVAEVEIVSRPRDALAGAYLRLVDGKPVEQGTRGTAPGTTVTVSKLFAKQPARLKFMRTPTSENNHIANLVSHYALAYPEVRFSLRLDGRQTLVTSGSGSLSDAVTTVYRPEVATAMLPIRRPAEQAGGTISVGGLLGPPSISRASRGYISLLVNRRWVQSRQLTFAVEEAYSGLLPSGRHPIAIINLRLPPEEVDVNVHPTKAEVRFRRANDVFSAVQRAARQTILEKAPVPSVSRKPAATASRPPTPQEAGMPPLWERALQREREDKARPATSTAPTPKTSLPVLRVIGQMGSTYIVAEGPHGLYLIDQHAAHERVLFEQLSAARQKQDVESQGLLEPAIVEISPRQEQILSSNQEALAEHGFQLEPFGQQAYLVRAIPAVLAGKDVSQAVTELLDLLDEESMADQRDRVASSLACHGAIRAGQTLALEEMRELVRALEQTEVPHTCPHGRPTLLHVSTDLLEKEFRRR